MASQVSARGVQALHREMEALELRRQGKRYDEISDALGVSLSTAWRLVHRGYQRSIKYNDELVEFNRKLDLERLDVALTAIWPSVKAGKVSAINGLLGILERRSKMLGLDVPAKQEMDIGDTISRILERLADSRGTTDN